MLEIFLTIIFGVIFILSSGLFAINYIFVNDRNNFHFAEIGLIGIVFLTFLTFLIHLILPLNSLVNFCIFIFIFLFGLKNNIKFLFLSVKKDYLISIIAFAIVFIMTLNYKPHEDYGFYHLPYIINLVSEKIIFGLSNLQPHFGWNSSWLNFTAVFYLPILELKGLHIANPILFFLILVLFLNKILDKNKKQNISKFFLLLLALYIIIKFSRISAHGFDFPANIFLLLTFYYFVEVYESENKTKINKYFFLILIFSTLSLTIKLSTFLAPLLVFSSFLMIENKKVQIKFFYRTIVFCTLFFSFWFVQQFIYSGCFVPMFEFTCVKSVSWYTQDISNSIKSATGAVNKSFRDYSGTLSQEEYLANFNWFKTWFSRNKTEFLEHLYAFIIPFIVILIFNFKKLFNSNKKFISKNKKDYTFIFTVIFFISVGLFLWLIKSPVIRFGIPYLFTFVFFSILSLYHIFKLEIVFEKGIIIVVMLALTFNFSKNLIRIFDHDYKGTYWPEILDVRYSTKKVGNFYVNSPDPEIKSSQNQLCWSIPFICNINSSSDIKIEKINNYLFFKQ